MNNEDTGAKKTSPVLVFGAQKTGGRLLYPLWVQISPPCFRAIRALKKSPGVASKPRPWAVDCRSFQSPPPKADLT